MQDVDPSRSTDDRNENPGTNDGGGNEHGLNDDVEPVSGGGSRLGRRKGKSRKKDKKPRILHWDIPHLLVILAVGLSYVYQYYHNSFDVFWKLGALTGSVGIVTAVVWKFSAHFTIGAFRSVFDLLHNKHDSLFRIRSPMSETGSLLDHLFMAVEWSIFPTLVVFFVLSFIAQGIAEEGKAVVENNMIFVFMFFIPPLTTFIFIPIRLLTDSSLMRYDLRKRTMEPFGLNFKRMFRAVGGVGALASFAKVALNKGGVENALWDTFTILLYIFPTIFIATILYGAWHPKYLRLVEKKIEHLHYRTYRFSRDVFGTIVLEPVAESEDKVEEDNDDNAEEEADVKNDGSWATPVNSGSLPSEPGIPGKEDITNDSVGYGEVDDDPSDEEIDDEDDGRGGIGEKGDLENEVSGDDEDENYTDNEDDDDDYYGE